MSAQEFFDNPAFVAYVRLLARLHALIRAGRDETPEGEELRSQMDAPGEQLSAEEVSAIKGIAADLYSLQDPPTARTIVNAKESLRLRQDALAARDAGRFHDAFACIRKCEPYLEPALAAALRGNVWRAVGEHSIAASYFAWAARMEPNNEVFAFYELDQLSQADPARALSQATRILADEKETRPAVVLKAAELVADSTKNSPLERAEPVLKQLADLLETAAIQLQTNGAESLHRQVFAGLTGLAGICRYRLGDVNAAADLFDRGLRVHPSSNALLIARGILQYGRNSKQAVSDFQQANALGAKNFWPLFYLAHYRLKRGDFVECLNACNQAKRYKESPKAEANVFEWIAICQSALPNPSIEEIRANFREARRLAPENDRIRRNQQTFEQAVIGACVSEVNWERPDETTVRLLGEEIGEFGYQPLPLAA